MSDPILPLDRCFFTLFISPPMLYVPVINYKQLLSKTMLGLMGAATALMFSPNIALGEASSNSDYLRTFPPQGLELKLKHEVEELNELYQEPPYQIYRHAAPEPTMSPERKALRESLAASSKERMRILVAEYYHKVLRLLTPTERAQLLRELKENQTALSGSRLVGDRTYTELMIEVLGGNE